MAHKLITKTHIWSDDEFVMLTTKGEFDNLEKKVQNLEKKLQYYVTDTILESNTRLLNERIDKINNDFENLKKTLLSALSNGEWKQSFSEDIKKALTDIDQRYFEINAELDKKMSQLAQAGAIEEKILQIFIEQEKQFRTVIRESGKQLKEELDKKMEDHGIIDILKIESQTITWEN